MMAFFEGRAADLRALEYYQVRVKLNCEVKV